MPSRSFVYILRCADGSLYTGYTIDLERRLKQHQAGRGGRYTRTHLPVELVYFETLRSRKRAMAREVQIKRLNRKGKLKLVGSAGRVILPVNRKPRAGHKPKRAPASRNSSDQS